MKNSLSSIKNKVDQAELYYYKSVHNGIEYQDGKLNELVGTIQSGYSLRVIKNNILGFAYTKNLTNFESLLQSAIDSLRAETRTNLIFPENKNSIMLETYDPGIEELDNQQVVEECNRIIQILKKNLNTKIDINAGYRISEIGILNTTGTELTSKFSHYILMCNIVFPNTANGLNYVFEGKKFMPVPDSDLRDLIEMYHLSEPEQKLKSGRIKVVFLPNSLYALLWRLNSGTAGSNIYYKKSPLINKVGEKIFSEKLTIYDDPHNDNYPLARTFDDEGTETKRLVIVEKGILRNFYYDLIYADKMGTQSTGNGYKSAMWGGEYAALKPAPAVEHLIIQPGEKNLKEIIGLMDKGIIVGGVLGAHSGNIPNGDFSIGIDPCFYVENGKIIGRVKNTMITGNIYDVMKNVIEIENKLHPTIFVGKALPSILFDDIMVVSA